MITVIPLDSRPCNHSWIEKFARMSATDLTIFPSNWSGNLHQGLRHDLLEDWLEEVLPKTDHLIVSMDALVSGGLIQARLARFELSEALARIQLLAKFKETKPDAKIVVFDTIMRTSITTYDSESSIYWALMNQYSLALGRFKKNPSSEHQEVLWNLEKQIPEHIRQTYLLARQKKHEINLLLLEYVHQGIIDDLVLLQEDSMNEGIQSFERLILEATIEKYHLEDRVSIYNGTDEGTAVLLAKILLEKSGKPLRLFVQTPSEKVLQKIQPFEDRPFGENLTKMAQKIGIELVSESHFADMDLFIYTEEEPYDLDLASMNTPKAKKDEIYQAFFQQLNLALSKNRKVAFLDVFFPNGGSNELLMEFDYHRLCAYSAWNTSSNAMGTLLANLVMIHVSKEIHPMQKQFTIERILDDCVFQTLSRRRINELALQSNINIYDLKHHGAEVLKQVQDQMKIDNCFYPESKYRVWFPWNRTFEIDIDVEE